MVESANTPEDRLRAIGIAESKIETFVKNKKNMARFIEILDICQIAELPKEKGNLLEAVAMKVKANLHPYTKTMVEYIVNGTWNKSKQIDEAIKFLTAKIGAHGNSYVIDEAELGAATGVGVVVTEEQICAAIDGLFEENREAIEKDKHDYNFPGLMKKLNAMFPWADGKALTETYNKKKVERVIVFGEAPVSDGKRKKAGKKTNEEKKDDMDKKNKRSQDTGNSKSATEKESAVGEFDITQFNGRDVGQSNSEELVAQHKATTGGKIQTRFPPEPNGYLHIGHAKSIRFNFSVAKQYAGNCYLRFDDTNPCKENNEFIDHIKDIVNWLGYTPFKTTASSDYFDQLHKFAVQLINQNQAYVCFQKPVEMSEYREKKLNSPYRDTSIEENLKLFEKMRNGYFEEGECSLRLKIDMTHDNPNMRDPCAYRVRYTAHPHSGDKWCIYPTYDYTHCIVDSLENITHSLCTLEFEIRRESYFWLLQALGIFRPNVWEFSRLNIDHTVTSKRKLQQLVDDKTVRGWDDPRLHSIQGLRRKGYTPSMINRFCEEIGVSRKGNENLTSYKVLEHFARLELDETAPRTFGVADALSIEIVNFEDVAAELREVKAALFPGNKEKLETQTYKLEKDIYIDRCDFSETFDSNFFGLSPEKPTVLRYGPTIEVVGTDKDASGVVTLVKVKAVPFVKGSKVIHWVSKAHAIPAELRLYGALMTEQDVAKVSKEQGKSWLEYYNKDALIEMHNAFVWNLHAGAKVFDKFQFERVGYFSVDQDTFAEGATKLVFNRVVELKEATAKKAPKK
jgi:glutaminyl-tRNA synthetase